MTGSEPPGGNAPDDDPWLPELIRQMEAIYAAREAANPAAAQAPAPPPEPWIDKPGTLLAAEREVFHLEIAERLRGGLCGDAARCKSPRCRRRRRCSALEEIASDLQVARARLAAERASWQPPPAPREASRVRRKR